MGGLKTPPAPPALQTALVADQNEVTDERALCKQDLHSTTQRLRVLDTTTLNTPKFVSPASSCAVLGSSVNCVMQQTLWLAVLCFCLAVLCCERHRQQEPQGLHGAQPRQQSGRRPQRDNRHFLTGPQPCLVLSASVYLSTLTPFPWNSFGGVTTSEDNTFSQSWPVPPSLPSPALSLLHPAAPPALHHHGRPLHWACLLAL